MLGKHRNVSTKTRGYLHLAYRHAAAAWLWKFWKSGLSIRETGQASAGMSAVQEKLVGDQPLTPRRSEKIANAMEAAGCTARFPSAVAGSQ
jgi:hypothetical protein